MTRILFIVKERGAYGQASGPKSPYSWPSGLSNSAHFSANAIRHYLKIETGVAIVKDNNHIYKAINKFEPTHVMIEALWVVPSKFKELIPLYPHITWVIRVHSKEVFLANEGIAIQWIREYQELRKVYPQIQVSFNNAETNENFRSIGIEDVYLPNIYSPINYGFVKEHHHRHFINIGCFGAIRPMKNQLTQAIAAIEFANSIGKKLHFHINSDRVEQKGDVVLKNIRALFKDRTDGHKLVEHGWYPHENFCKVISQMDIGMQVSLSESFNIVTADFVKIGVPIIVSQDIDWMPWFTKANTTDVKSMVHRLHLNYGISKISVFASRVNLSKHNTKALVAWDKYLSC